MAQSYERDDGSLKHIYFFMSPPSLSLAVESTANLPIDNGSAMSSPVRQDSVLSGRSDTGSDDGSDADSRSTTNSTSSSGARLNPQAQAFVPSPERKTFDKKASRDFKKSPAQKAKKTEVRITEDKGHATFAARYLNAGTCLVKEQPLMKIEGGNFLRNVDPAYRKLNAEARAKFDSLHCFKRDIFEHTARVNALDAGEEVMGDEEAFVSEQVRVMSIFACNVFGMGPHQGVCCEASRYNHSCRPNAHQSFNPSLGKEVIYTIRDIQPGEEICLNYLGGAASYMSTEERRERLMRDYGFYCTCSACLEPADGQSNGIRGLLNVLVAGYSSYLSGQKTWAPAPAIPTDARSALDICEEMIRCFLTEGLINMELAKAYRSASNEAVHRDNPEKAFEYSFREAELERNLLGDQIEDLIQCGAATSLWIDHLRKTFGGAEYGGRGPNRIPTRYAKKKKTGKKAKQFRSKMEKKAKQAAEAAAAREAKRAEEERRREEERRKREYDAKFPALTS